MAPKQQKELPPRPWRVAESNGGKFFMYDADNKCIIVPNVSSTGKTQEELKAIYYLIVNCVNKAYEEYIEELAAFDRAFPKVGGK